MSELASALGGRFLHPFTNNLALESISHKMNMFWISATAKFVY